MFGSQGMILSPVLLVIFLIVVVAGYAVVNFIANRKWGYTPKREREVERQADMIMHHKRKQKDNQKKETDIE